MPYNYTCDGCQTHSKDSPPFMGEFRESFLKTNGGMFADAGFRPGQTITLCSSCCSNLLL